MFILGERFYMTYLVKDVMTAEEKENDMICIMKSISMVLMNNGLSIGKIVQIEDFIEML